MNRVHSHIVRLEGEPTDPRRSLRATSEKALGLSSTNLEITKGGEAPCVVCVNERGRPPYIGWRGQFPGGFGAISTSTDVSLHGRILVGKEDANRLSLGSPNQWVSRTRPGPSGCRLWLVGWWAPVVALSCGPYLCCVVLLRFGSIIDYAESPYVVLRVSLVVLHVFPRFRLLVSKYIIDETLDDMLGRDANPLLLE
jgi:hypothetical protein